ncbi:MAG TPA: tetratricopeptide repeat protein [Thermoanaerobaculia bacterium]|nr:tetratricopeptide repeat protein [Thermoanaerobaculia bacterium]
MKKTLTLAAAILCLAATLFAAEDWRGNNRISGTVVDKATGKPVANAKVSLRLGSRGGPDATTDSNGKWAVLGLSSGSWNIDVSAPGYVTKQGSVAMAESQRIPPLKIEMEAQVAVAPKAEEAAPQVEQVKIGGQVVSKDIADAVEAGNNALGAKDYKGAVSNYEKASAGLPGYMPIKFALARAYYGANDLPKATVAMEEVYKSEPTNAQYASLYANMLLEQGQFDKAKEVIEKLPEGALDMNTLLNAGIALMNKKQPGAALTYFNKAVALDANSHLGYYYRGLAKIQQGKGKDAKADLQKAIELAPTSDEAKDAKEYLKSIK